MSQSSSSSGNVGDGRERVRVTYASFAGNACTLADMLWCRPCARLVAYDPDHHSFPHLASNNVQGHLSGDGDGDGDGDEGGDGDAIGIAVKKYPPQPATATEIDSYYCPQCLNIMTSNEALKLRHRCFRCVACPVCASPASVIGSSSRHSLASLRRQKELDERRIELYMQPLKADGTGKGKGKGKWKGRGALGATEAEQQQWPSTNAVYTPGKERNSTESAANAATQEKGKKKYAYYFSCGYCRWSSLPPENPEDGSDENDPEGSAISDLHYFVAETTKELISSLKERERWLSGDAYAQHVSDSVSDQILLQAKIHDLEAQIEQNPDMDPKIYSSLQLQVANLRYGPVYEAEEENDGTGGKPAMVHKTKAFPWKVADAEKICNYFEKSRDSKREACKNEMSKNKNGGGDDAKTSEQSLAPSELIPNLSRRMVTSPLPPSQTASSDLFSRLCSMNLPRAANYSIHLPQRVQLASKKVIRCMECWARKDRSGLLMKSEINPLTGDSSRRVKSAWFKKKSLAVEFIPNIRVMLAESLPAGGSDEHQRKMNKKTMRVLLHIHNPSDVDVSMRLSPVLPVQMDKNTEGNPNTEENTYNAVCAFGNANMIAEDDTAAATSIAGTSTTVQLLAFDDMATGDEPLPEGVAEHDNPAIVLEREGSSVLLALVVEEYGEGEEEANEANEGHRALYFGLDVHTQQELTESQDTIDVDVYESEANAADSTTKKPMSNGYVSRHPIQNGEGEGEESMKQMIEIDFRVHIEIPLSGYKLLVNQTAR